MITAIVDGRVHIRACYDLDTFFDQVHRNLMPDYESDSWHRARVCPAADRKCRRRSACIKHRSPRYLYGMHLQSRVLHSGFDKTEVLDLNLYVNYSNRFNYVAMAAPMLRLFVRACHVQFGRNNQLFGRKVAATCIRLPAQKCRA